jgi:tetratricopeptide (TPR) repeat protein
MDDPWHRMTSPQQQRIRGLSADLYTLEPDSPIEHPDKVETPNEEILNELHERQKQGDFAAVLALLREHPQQFDRARAAFERGVAYIHLNDYEIALLFFDEALRLRPGEPSALACRLVALTNGGREAEAERDAQQIAADGAADPTSLVVAGQFLFHQATKRQDGERKRLYADGVNALQRGLKLFAGKTSSAEVRQAVKSAHLYIAVWLEDRGKREEARQECLAALNIDPNFQHALTLLGWLDFQQTPDAQRADFRRIFPATIPPPFNSFGTQAA